LQCKLESILFGVSTTKLSLAVNPQARFSAAFATLTLSGAPASLMVMFGGLAHATGSNAITMLSDFWLFDFGARMWRSLPQVSVNSQGRLPVGRFSATSSSFGAENKMVMGAGVLLSPDGTTFSGLKDMWLGHIACDGACWHWTELNVLTGPAFVGKEFLSASTAVHGFGDASGTSILLVGGVTEDATSIDYLLVDVYPIVLQMGCNAGSFAANFSTDPCVLCPVGTYVGSPGNSVCTPCPNGTTTAAEGSLALTACTLCAQGQCDHGECTVESIGSSYVMQCKCSFGWYGRSCQSNAFGIAVGVTLVIGIILLLVFLRIRSLKGQSAKIIEYSNLQEELLARRDDQITELRSVWQIDHDEIVRGGCVFGLGLC
jgi:hypothetical protein